MDKVTSTKHNLNTINTETPRAEQAQNNSDPAMPVMKEKKSAEMSLQNTPVPHQTHQTNSNANSTISLQNHTSQIIQDLWGLISSFRDETESIEPSTSTTATHASSCNKNVNDQANYTTLLPTDVKNYIFALAGNAVEFSVDATKGLLSFARSSKQSWTDVQNFLKEDAVGIEFAKKFKNSQAKVWDAKSKDLISNAPHYKNRCWAQSATAFLTQHSLKKNGLPEILPAVNYMGVEIPFRSLEKYTEITSTLIKEINPGTTIKFNAQGIGRERVLAEVFPALMDADLHCPLIVNLSGNNLTEEDLKPLTEFMAKNPTIYQLDLSDNDLCTGDTPSAGLQELFRVLGPVSHLYLNNTGLNDSTAENIHEHIKSNIQLKSLDLRQNQLSAKGAVSIINTVAATSTPIEEPIEDDAVIHVHKSLRVVRLQDNPFGSDATVVRVIRRGHMLLVSGENWKNYNPYAVDLDPFIEIYDYQDGSPNSINDLFQIMFDSRAEQEKL